MGTISSPLYTNWCFWGIKNRLYLKENQGGITNGIQNDFKRGTN